MRIQGRAWAADVHAAVLRGICLGGVLALVAGCGTSSAVALTPTVPAGHPTLAKCIAAWNEAVLGTGKRFVRSVAADGEAALMFVFRDRACGLAFPEHVSQDAGTVGVFVSALDGDYQLVSDPLSGPGSSATLGERDVQQRASGLTNVRVDPRTGEVAATVPGDEIATVPFTLLDTKTACTTVIAQPSGTGWKVVKRTVSWLWVRTLVWAWMDRTGKVVKTPGSNRLVRQVLGWRCVGSDLRALGQGSPRVYTRVSCRDGMKVVQISR